MSCPPTHTCSPAEVKIVRENGKKKIKREREVAIVATCAATATAAAATYNICAD